MKNTFKFKAMLRIAVIIALAAIIGFSFTACGGDDGDNGGGGGQVSITITGIPAGTTGNWTLYLNYLDGQMLAESTEVSVGGLTSVTFLMTMVWQQGTPFTSAGNYKVFIESNSATIYSIASKNISSGANTIPLSEFTQN